MKRVTVLYVLAVLWMLSSCAYLNSVSKQNKLEKSLDSNPLQYNIKHIIERDTYFVYGRLLRETPKESQYSLAIAAFSNRYQQNELVDVNHLGKVNSYYGLNLPEGEYTLLVLEDKNKDNRYSTTEVIANRVLELSAKDYPDRVVSNVDISLLSPIASSIKFQDIAVVPVPDIKESISYPKGSIRSFSDPIFSRNMSSLGMYDSAAFMETAPMFFYALEEYVGYKIPVVFVHGIGGTVREFQFIIDRLDRERYMPLFFYYPSGMDLNQLAKAFYNIYLSGKVIKKEFNPMIIVAHSMGGLVVREALNLYQGNEQESVVKLFVSIASPFGGLKSAKQGVEHAPLVLPAWRNLSPDDKFIKKLFRNELPSLTDHYLFYAYLGAGGSDDSDGVVPVASQLTVSALDQITGDYGFKSGHAEILQHPVATDKLLGLITQVENYFPDDHLHYFLKGGFDVELDDSYNKFEKHIIRTMGFYIRAITNGDITPLPISDRFMSVMRGEVEPIGPYDTGWLKFRRDYPDLASGNAE